MQGQWEDIGSDELPFTDRDGEQLVGLHPLDVDEQLPGARFEVTGLLDEPVEVLRRRRVMGARERGDVPQVREVVLEVLIDGPLDPIGRLLEPFGGLQPGVVLQFVRHPIATDCADHQDGDRGNVSEQPPAPTMGRVPTLDHVPEIGIRRSPLDGLIGSFPGPFGPERMGRSAGSAAATAG